MQVVRIFKVVAVFLCVLLVACISFPSTPQHFRNEAFDVRTFEVGVPLETAFEVVESNTIRCHQATSSQMSMVGTSTFMTTSSHINVHSEEAEDAATVGVHFSNISADGYLQVIDLKRLKSGGTRVSVYNLNDRKKWRTAAESVERWFSADYPCYEL